MKVVIRTDRGVELGQVVTPVSRDDDRKPYPCSICGGQLEDFLENEGGDYPFRRNGRLLRIANQQDMIEHRHLVDSAKHAGKYCRDQIRELELPMRLVTVEHLLGGERIVFYFTAEQRVDFRELVRRLAGQYRTRIEMRQVGARDEARLVGDYERCGQRCCCQQFLKDLKPVSMRMAKVQKATLDPSKISGRCGRLMCCLRYEDKGYNELRKNLPHRNTWVRTEDTLGRVIDTQIITQLAKIMQPDGNIVAVRVDEIVERNLKPPTDDEARQHASRSRSENRKEQIDQAVSNVDGVKVEPAEDKASQKDDGGDSSNRQKPKRRGRRRRGRRRSKGKKGGGSDGGQQGSGGGKSKGRRRRKKGKGGGTPGSGGS
jgi:cell fate regulator YaaT (PSP1 superfamily)